MKNTSVFLFSFLMMGKAQAQIVDSTHAVDPSDTIHLEYNWKKSAGQSLKAAQFIVPGIAVTYGFSTIASPGLQNINKKFRHEIYEEHPHGKVRIDNYLQIAPAALVYGLDLAGVKAKHNLRDRTMLLLMSNVITNGTVFSIKNVAHQLRPDGSDHLSFPSGHTAEAFANAEFMRQEYKDVSPWYGVAGYAIAATTGYLRMYNNKHWFSDVVAGAGIGMASTKIAYWLYPKIQNKIFKEKPAKTMIMPSYQNGSFGFGMAHVF